MRYDIEVDIPECRYVDPPEGLVVLTYFKTSGKMYSTAAYITKHIHSYQVHQEVRDFVRRGNLPGLMEGPCEFIVLVECPGLKLNVHRIILPPFLVNQVYLASGEAE